CVLSSEASRRRVCPPVGHDQCSSASNKRSTGRTTRAAPAIPTRLILTPSLGGPPHLSSITMAWSCRRPFWTCSSPAGPTVNIRGRHVYNSSGSPQVETGRLGMVEGFDLVEREQRLRQHVAALAAVPRPPGSAAHRQAQGYIREHLTRAGFTVEADAYRA